MSLAAIRPWAQVAAVVWLALAAFPVVEVVAGLTASWPLWASLALVSAPLACVGAGAWRWAR